MVFCLLSRFNGREKAVGGSVHLLDIQPCPVSRKSPHSRRFLNDLVGGFTGSMSRARLNADEVRLGTNLRRLKCSDIFEGVPWYHAIVCIGSGGKNCGICLAGLDVVIRRIF